MESGLQASKYNKSLGKRLPGKQSDTLDYSVQHPCQNPGKRQIAATPPTPHSTYFSTTTEAMCSSGYKCCENIYSSRPVYYCCKTTHTHIKGQDMYKQLKGAASDSACSRLSVESVTNKCSMPPGLAAEYSSSHDK